MKYIVIDGVKYQIDPTDSTKALMGTDGQPIPYVEEVPPITPSSESLEELAKTNPAVARMLAEKKQLEEDATARNAQAEADRIATLTANGEFQKIAEEAETKRKIAEDKAIEAVAKLDEYKGTVKVILDDMLAQIPEDKKALIPEVSPRKKIDYIRQNQKFLGVSLVNKGGHVPPNDTPPPLDEEGKNRKEFAELAGKDTLTPSESARMSELAKILKGYKAKT